MATLNVARLAAISRKASRAASMLAEAQQELMSLPIVDSETGRQMASARAQATYAANVLSAWTTGMQHHYNGGADKITKPTLKAAKLCRVCFLGLTIAQIEDTDAFLQKGIYHLVANKNPVRAICATGAI